MENEIQRAIEYLRELLLEWEALCLFHCTHKYKNGIELAIAALERQKPKPPILKVHEKYRALGENYYCECGVMFGDFKRNGTNYCGNCGQRLRELVRCGE